MNNDLPGTPVQSGVGEKKSEGRRGFLLGLAGLATAAMPAMGNEEKCRMSSPVGACASGGDPVIVNPNGTIDKCDPLCDSEAKTYYQVVARAWSSTAYREKLLTFPVGEGVYWSLFSYEEREKMLRDTEAALRECKGAWELASVGNTRIPVVLLGDQMDGRVFLKKDEKERILRLPMFCMANDRVQQIDIVTTGIEALKSSVCGM